MSSAEKIGNINKSYAWLQKTSLHEGHDKDGTSSGGSLTPAPGGGGIYHARCRRCKNALEKVHNTEGMRARPGYTVE